MTLILMSSLNLKECPWQVMDVYDDINDMVEYFTKFFFDICKEFIRNKQITIHPKDKPWMTSIIKAKLKE